MKEHIDKSHAARARSTDAASAGFHAHLQGVTLYALVVLQQLMRCSAVYLIVAGDRSGALHFSDGELVHAQTGHLTGDLAALEILSWAEGEFIRSTQRPADTSSVTSTLQQLLSESAGGDIAPEPLPGTATGIRRRPEMSAPGLQPGPHSAAAAGRSAAAGAARALAAVATPGTAGATQGLVASPAEVRADVHVLVSPRGEIVDSHGRDVENVASRVAYVMRLAELIGQAMGSGEARAVAVRGPQGDLNVRRHADGHISGSCGNADARAGDGVTPPHDGAGATLTHSNPSSVDSGRALHALRDIDGVYGSFAINAGGEVLARDLPAVFDDATLTDSGSRVVRLWDVVSENGQPEYALIEFAEYSLFVRRAGAGSLCVVVPSYVNVLALRIASKWVARQLEGAARAST